MNQSWKNMGVLQIKVIMHSINIGWHNTGKHTSIRILLMVCPVKKKTLLIKCLYTALFDLVPGNPRGSWEPD